jgi:DNA-binding MarR family transcriptional regulator
MTVLPPTLEFLRRLWRLNHALERRSSRMHTEIGITAQQRMVLRCLGCLGEVHAGELADVLHLDPGTLSATLRRLEERKLVRRARDDADSRRVRIALTADGRRLDVPTPGTVEAAVAQLLADTEPDDLARTARVLERFAAALEAVDQRAPERAEP